VLFDIDGITIHSPVLRNLLTPASISLSLSTSDECGSYFSVAT
jgi:hypothetical protein